MVRTALVMVLGLAALATGPLASTAKAETPRQVWLQNHPIAAENIWAENHSYRSGLLPYVPPVDRVVVDPIVRVGPVVRVYHPFGRWYR